MTKVLFSQSHETNRYFDATMWGINGAYGIIFDELGIRIWDVANNRAIKWVGWDA